MYARWRSKVTARRASCRSVASQNASLFLTEPIRPRLPGHVVIVHRVRGRRHCGRASPCRGTIASDCRFEAGDLRRANWPPLGGAAEAAGPPAGASYRSIAIGLLPLGASRRELHDGVRGQGKLGTTRKYIARSRRAGCRADCRRSRGVMVGVNPNRDGVGAEKVRPPLSAFRSPL